jgi:hypothetical protein
MLNRQLELTLKSTRSRSPTASNSRKGRARWWFDRMHQVVDNARDYSSHSSELASGASRGWTR